MQTRGNQLCFVLKQEKKVALCASKQNSIIADLNVDCDKWKMLLFVIAHSWIT